MSLWRTFKVAWEGLTLNKVRSFLTTLGVIIVVGAVVVPTIEMLSSVVEPALMSWVVDCSAETPPTRLTFSSMALMSS